MQQCTTSHARACDVLRAQGLSCPLRQIGCGITDMISRQLESLHPNELLTTTPFLGPCISSYHLKLQAWRDSCVSPTPIPPQIPGGLGGAVGILLDSVFLF